MGAQQSALKQEVCLSEGLCVQLSLNNGWIYTDGFRIEGKQTLDEPCEDGQPCIHEHEQMHVDVYDMLCFNGCH
jgi:hypothetical protein